MRVLDFPALKLRKGHPFSRRHTDRLVKAGLFPAPIDAGVNRRVWIEEEIDQHYERLAAQRAPVAA
jgi:prophage regulatory protein